MRLVFGICFIMLIGLGTVKAEALIPMIDFEDAPVINVVQALAKSAGLDLVLSGDQAQGQARKATIHLKDVTADEAIDFILRTNGFNYERKGKVLLVSSLPQDLAQTAYKTEAQVTRLKYLSAGKASELLGKIFPAAVFQAGGNSNTLIIRGREMEIKDAKELLLAIDKRAPQILIESRVVELSQSDSVKLGISYGNGAYKFITNKTTRKTAPAEDLTSTLNALVTDGRANIIASPRIATLDNQEALINIGSRIPYAVPVSSGSSTTQWTVDYIDAGVKLKITPQLGQDGDITTFIQPEVSSVSEWRTTSAGDFPVISTRNASATVRVKDGETIVIGGLLSETERENISKVPIVGQIPVLGLLFQNRTIEKGKTEIVFLITPHVI
ncbi:MAG: secretin and TonB N-terminal domain-containing protein [Candidatus Margulisbacteria bacterium]|nr:secretin and TonB N-terminal domain-containing protein [Candidatus Margulisiibacteriota bacterium]